MGKPKGGSRPGSGRPRTKNIGNEEFADKVLKRIRELNLTWPDGRPIRNDVDYALYLLASKDERVRKEVFIDLVVRKHGPAGKMALKSTEVSTFQVIVEHIGARPEP